MASDDSEAERDTTRAGAKGTSRDRIRELVADCVERIDRDGVVMLGEVCRDEPELLDSVRERLALLIEFGFISLEGLREDSRSGPRRE